MTRAALSGDGRQTTILGDKAFVQTKWPKASVIVSQDKRIPGGETTAYLVPGDGRAAILAIAGDEDGAWAAAARRLRHGR